MVTAGSGWLDVDADAETIEENIARGGLLSNAGRRAAIASALPLLARYFASGSQSLEIRQAVMRQQSAAVGDVIESLRLRVALAAADRLSLLLARIVERPTFRYQLVSVPQATSLTGQLDVNRYATQAGLSGDVLTYPIVDVQRVQRTPENVLAAYAACWILRELDSARAGVSLPDGPELATWRLERRRLAEQLRLPVLASCLRPAQEIVRAGQERRLISHVQRRLRRREVTNASPYVALVEWMDACLSGDPAAQPGEVEWAFYGERFDTKLFELWCLYLLAGEVSRQLVLDRPPLNPAWRRGEFTYRWERPAGTLEMYFQNSIATIAPTRQARWRRVDAPSGTLGGVPDIVVRAVRREDGRERFAIFDPKLRQRSGPPAEELYKLLGYLDNFGLGDDPYGAILYHTTADESLPSYKYQTADVGGQLLAVALNPARSEVSVAAFQSIATMVLSLLDIPPLAVQDGTIDSDDREDAAEARIEARKRELLALAATMPAEVLEASRRRMRMILGDQRWHILPSSAQTMLATSEHVGFSLDGAADFSGPVIGVCASVETVLFEQIMAPISAYDRRLTSSCRTLGQVIRAIREAMSGQRGPLHRAIRRQLQVSDRQRGQQIRRLTDLLAEMNTKYRIPAAHRDVVSEAKWRLAWEMVLGRRQLLSRSLDLLGEQTAGNR